MGMTILQAKQRLHEKWMQLTKDGTDEEMMQALSIADTVLGNYNETLKADLKAILVELQLKIEEKFNDRPFSYNHHQRTEFYRDIDEVIQQKIDKLKED
jgi:hypothetical protein